MEEKGRILDVSRDWKAGSTRVYLEIPGNHTEELDKLADKDISVSIRQHRINGAWMPTPIIGYWPENWQRHEDYQCSHA